MMILFLNFIIHFLHLSYTTGRKPWNCISVGSPGRSGGKAIDTGSGKLGKIQNSIVVASLFKNVGY